ncbi:hypothetical protein MKW98_015020, partial [Papaver atlanticum]
MSVPALLISFSGKKKVKGSVVVSNGVAGAGMYHASLVVIRLEGDSATTQVKKWKARTKTSFWVSLYFCGWGEAGNVRFLPECMCYIFHHMAKELILDHGEAQPAVSRTGDNGSVSCLEHVISTIYETMAK